MTRDVADAAALRRYYEEHLFHQILPFWLEKAIDQEQGGYFTGFANSGGKLLHEHKFTWSQGRFVWVWARLAAQFSERPEAQHYSALARSGADFLMRHALLPNGHIAFILSRQGQPILLDSHGQPLQAGPGERYDTSTFADCFVIYGLSEYARLSGERAAFDFAARLYDSVEERLAAGEFRTDPYPTPPGYRQHGVPMILLETSRELAITADGFDPSRAEALRQRAREFARQIMREQRPAGEDVLIEFLGSDGRVQDNMLGTYVNPGHTLECMWFIMHYAEEMGDTELLRQAVEVTRRACEIGWDEQYGGLYQFTHMVGGPPRGEVLPEHESHAMIAKLRQDWDTKLWWVHSEALYVLLLAAYHGAGDWADDWYGRVHDYTFRTFPAKPGGEWIAIRTREGTPVDKVVALPVKDPFHVPRAFMHIIRLLERGQHA